MDSLVASSIESSCHVRPLYKLKKWRKRPPSTSRINKLASNDSSGNSSLIKLSGKHLTSETISLTSGKLPSVQNPKKKFLLKAVDMRGMNVDNLTHRLDVNRRKRPRSVSSACDPLTTFDDTDGVSKPSIGGTRLLKKQRGDGDGFSYAHSFDSDGMSESSRWKNINSACEKGDILMVVDLLLEYRHEQPSIQFIEEAVHSALHHQHDLVATELVSYFKSQLSGMNLHEMLHHAQLKGLYQFIHHLLSLIKAENKPNLISTHCIVDLYAKSKQVDSSILHDILRHHLRWLLDMKWCHEKALNDGSSGACYSSLTRRMLEVLKK